MASVTFQTPEGAVTVTYQLAAGVAKVRAFVAAMRFGTFLGDMGDRFHQWNDGIPSHGRRRGDHTAWSADGPVGVVKAFDWDPDDMARFKRWLIPQLRAGRYKAVCKFVNLDYYQWNGDGQEGGPSNDRHLHWSFMAVAVNAAVNPIEDYYREVEDDMYEQTDRQRDINTNGRAAEVYPIKKTVTEIKDAVAEIQATLAQPAPVTLTDEQLDQLTARLAALVPTAEQIAVAVAVEDNRRTAE